MILNLSMADGNKKGQMQNKKVHQMFYNTPKYDCCKTTQLHWQGGPRPLQSYHPMQAHSVLPTKMENWASLSNLPNKDIIIRHLQLLFAQISHLGINDYGLVKDYSCKAFHEQIASN
jgi:hypothetical protein